MSNTQHYPDALMLVVDDDAAVASLLDELLSEEGYQVLLARTLADARTHLAANEPDVILLDVQLPDGSGFDFCEQLRSDAKTVDMPILFLSAVDRSADSVARGLDLGGYDFLSKPFRNVELLARVRVLVRLRVLQQRLIAQERERAMLATAGAAAHSLAQPLMAALGLTSLLLKDELTSQQRHDLEMIYGALQQMSTTVHQIQEVQHFITQPYLDDQPDIEILNIEEASALRQPE
jgi:DNA-binding response OmpR family regulator